MLPRQLIVQNSPSITLRGTPPSSSASDCPTCRTRKKRGVSIDCRQKRSGNMPAVPGRRVRFISAMTSHQRRRISTVRIPLVQRIKDHSSIERQSSAPINRMHGVCMTCTAISTSGASIGSIGNITAIRPRLIHVAPRPVRLASFAAATGTATVAIAGVRFDTPTSPTVDFMPSACELCAN